jgi:hypothetical protein
MRTLVVIALGLASCGGSAKSTPEQIASDGKDGQRVEVTGEVHTVTFESKASAARRAFVARHAGIDPLVWLLDDDEEEQRGARPAYDDPEQGYPRTPDHYVLIRSVKPAGITFGDPEFVAGKLAAAWGLGVRLTGVDPAAPLPEVGATIKVTGTLRRIDWNQRGEQLPVVEDAAIVIVSGPAALAGPGEPCALDQACNARLVCDRATRTCAAPPRQISWADPWRNLNGACDSDADCPLGQRCDLDHPMTATGSYAPNYFAATDVGRHSCVLDAATTLAAACPRIYSARDLVGGRFVTGKEICVRATVLSPVLASDRDTHVQVVVDEPIPYPSADIGFHLFGASTENGPTYKNPALGAGMVADPAAGDDVVVLGTYRYDAGHGWYEIHPVKRFFPAPR